MKKILLFGTMLGIAGTALAFGGVFNHGSKSTTYKGGVNAIGVHFGGEKKTADTKPAEKTCQDGTPCGEGCCYGDNTCQQTLSGEYQCCNDNISLCCDVNQTATWDSDTNSAHCCSGTPYCSSTNVDGDCVRDYYSCCDGTPFIWAKFSYGDQYRCCSGTVYKEVGADGSDVCCQGETKRTCAYYDENENCSHYTCCKSNETPYCRYIDTSNSMKCYSGGCCDLEVNDLIRSQPNSDNPNLLCCEKGGERYVLDDGYVKCCPVGFGLDMNNTCCKNNLIFEDQWGWKQCCPTEFFDSNNDECCPEGTTTYEYNQCCGYNNTSFVDDLDGNRHCCASDSTGWSSEDGCCESGTQPTEDPDGGTHCCPLGSTGYSWNDGCCEPGTQPTEDPDGETHCCPLGSTGYSWNDGCCESGTQPTEDPDGETHCCPNGWDEDNWECA